MTAAGRPAAVLKQAVTDDSKFGYSSSCLFGYTPLMRTVNQCHASVRVCVCARMRTCVRMFVPVGRRFCMGITTRGDMRVRMRV